MHINADVVAFAGDHSRLYGKIKVSDLNYIQNLCSIKLINWGFCACIGMNQQDYQQQQQQQNSGPSQNRGYSPQQQTQAQQGRGRGRRMRRPSYSRF